MSIKSNKYNIKSKDINTWATQPVQIKSLTYEKGNRVLSEPTNIDYYYDRKPIEDSNRPALKKANSLWTQVNTYSKPFPIDTTFFYKDGGDINELGYKDVSPYKDRSFIDINSNKITMKGVSKHLKGDGYDKDMNLIHSMLMKPGEDYEFQPKVTLVRETPIHQNGNKIPPISQMQIAKSKQQIIDDHNILLKKQFNQNKPQTFENKINNFLDNPMDKAYDAGEKFAGNNDPIDNFRHPMAGRYTAEAITKKTGNIPILSKTLGFIGSNALGIGHEIMNPNLGTKKNSMSKFETIREAAEDIFNNSVGALVGTLPLSDSTKTKTLKYLSDKNLLPDGYGKDNMYFKHQNGGNIAPSQEEIDYANSILTNTKKPFVKDYLDNKIDFHFNGRIAFPKTADLNTDMIKSLREGTYIDLKTRENLDKFARGLKGVKNYISLNKPIPKGQKGLVIQNNSNPIWKNISSDTIDPLVASKNYNANTLGDLKSQPNLQKLALYNKLSTFTDSKTFPLLEQNVQTHYGMDKGYFSRASGKITPLGESVKFTTNPNTSAIKYDINHIQSNLDNPVYSAFNNIYKKKQSLESNYYNDFDNKVRTKQIPISPVFTPANKLIATSHLKGGIIPNKIFMAKKGLKLFPIYKLFMYNQGGNLIQLNGKGEPETVLKGEERIFSIPHTKEIVNKATKAKTKEDIVELGKQVEKILQKQNTQKPEYVK